MSTKIIRSMVVLLLISLLLGCSDKEVFKGKFGFEPVNPQAGDNIRIYYLADSSKLADAKEVTMIAYPYKVSVDTLIEMEMMKEGDYWTVKLSVPDNERGVVFKFVSGKLFDNNSGQGYVMFLTNGKGKLVPGAKAGFASAINGWGRSAEIKRNSDKSFKYFKEDFLDNPEIKYEYLDSYFGLIFRKDKTAAKTEIETELDSLIKKENKSEADYSLIYNWFNRLQENNKAESIVKAGLKQYPKGKFAKQMRMNSFNRESDYSKKIDIINKFQKDFPKDDFVDNFYNSLLYQYTRSTLYDDAYNLITKNSGKISSAYFPYVAGKMMGNKFNAKKVEKIYRIGIKKSKADLSGDISKNKPKTSTIDDYKESLNYYLGRNLSGLGKLLYDNKKVAKAIPYLKEGIETMEEISSDPETNEIYVTALFKSGKIDETMKTIENFIDKSESTKGMTEILKKAYVKKNGSDNDFDEYLAKFTGMAKEKMESDLKNEMKNMPAPQFTLYNLKGKKVSLADYKGKTVVVDFWATWCGPCKSSFPGMQKLVDFYKNNDVVKFLFVNTWENAKDKETNARLFITENKYSFNVLMDDNNKVVADFGVSGIPTKYIIDKNGNIRFESVGFSGSADQMVDEVKAMINMIK